MQNYPQYYPQMNNYGQPVNPQQPYMDRLASLQQYQQSLQPNPMPYQQFQGLNGKVVDSLECVTANDVPMDGSFAIFPKKDMSEIYVKSWTPNGTIATVVFKPVSEEQANQYTPIQSEIKIELDNKVTEAFMQRFDELKTKIEELEESMNKPMTKTSASKTKKESEA